jgi:membrane protein DedA with SNARE-associated domain
VRAGQVNDHILSFGETIAQLVSNYGYPGLYFYFLVDALGILLPSKSILALIGFMIGEGVFSYPPVVVTAVLGSLTGVTVSFSIGRNICKPAAEKFGRRFFVTPERLIKAEKWFGRFGAPFIIIAYFVPGMRHITPYLCGIARLPYYKVILYSAVGAFLWVVTFTYLGRLIQANWR